jgi:hypothetical protein
VSRDERTATRAPSAADLDPFAGDDEPWAAEDLEPEAVGTLLRGRPTNVSFLRAATVVVLGAVLAWAAIGAIALQVYRLVTG